MTPVSGAAVVVEDHLSIELFEGHQTVTLC
jgi:hypothetical protein